MSFVEELTWRGLHHQSSEPRLADLMKGERFSAYIGFDPTASSLHVGSLLQILALMRLQRAGHRPVALVGGATGLIGDPSGKSAERNLISVETVEKNLVGVRAQLERFLDFSPSAGAIMVNNADWFRGLGYLDFLRDVGKHFTVNMMLGKESVRARLEDRESGISYTEFSYMLIQAYDFLWLHDHHGCRLQLGGSDQWGNITAGIELVRRLRGKEAYGLTQPLVLDSAGNKFGKTEKGAVWLDAERTSPFDFYQFFVRAGDADVGRYLRYYTFLDEKTIRELDEATAARPEKREAQKTLAREVTAMVHGAEEAKKAEEAAAALFSGGVSADAPTTEIARAQLGTLLLVDALVQTQLAKSKSEARRKLQEGGVYVNDERVAEDRALQSSDERGGQIVLRVGKKSYHLLKLV